jgi:hypothetical protein
LVLETSAHSLAILDAASRQDPERTTRLVQRMIAVEESIPTVDALLAGS